MALIYPIIALPIAILFILGMIILAKGKLSISRRKELSGGPAKFLSFSYIVISIVAFVKIFFYTGDVMIDYPVFGAFTLAVTIISIFFAKQTQTSGI